MRVLIDGYNLLFQSGLLPRRRGPDGLQRARRSLIRHLARLLEPEAVERTVVVFDAQQQPPGIDTVEKLHGITVLYAVNYEDADELLEELIRREPTPKRLLVVSSDRRIQRAARRPRAHPVDSFEWWNELQSPGPGRDEPLDDEDEEKPDIGNPFPEGYGL